MMNLQSIITGWRETQNALVATCNNATKQVEDATTRVNGVGAQIQEEVVKPLVRGGVIPATKKD